MSKAASTVAFWVNSGTTAAEVWTRVKKATTFTLSMNVVEEDFDYIADETKTTEVKSYSPSVPLDIALLPGEPDYEFFWEMYKKLPTGQEAHKEFLTVYLKDGNNTAGFFTRKQEAVVSFNDFNSTDGKLNLTVKFCGTATDGTSKVENGVCTFTPATATPAVAQYLSRNEDD